MSQKHLSMMVLALTALLAFTEAASAASAVVNKSTCSKLANTTQPFILLLTADDDLLGSISQCAKDAKLIGASISGLGQLKNPTLAYLGSTLNDKPSYNTLHGYYELASINGNIAVNGSEYFTHAHGVLADKKYHPMAGHINSAKVGVSVEITIIPFSGTLERTVDAKTGFGLLKL
jgi:predicted DNA-binding protein with PD1-like motif